MWVLKYQPVHGVVEKDASPERNAMWAREAQRTLDGWDIYVKETCALVSEALGTAGQKDAGFDLEVWNEQTFGSNFLDINRYLDPGLNFTKPVAYARKRVLTDALRPDAKTDFVYQGSGAFLGITATFIDLNRDKYPGVKVDNGFGNQWPWNGAGDGFPGEGAFSRHFYLGSWRGISPTQNSRVDLQTISALGQGDGTRPTPPKDWYDIVPGSNFIPTFRAGLPEWGYTSFQTENIARDVMPNSRMSGSGTNHGRFSHNGDFHPLEMYQTEFTYGRQGFFDRLFSETKVSRDDPRALALDDWFNSKVLLRSYVFQNHKGLKRLYMFAPADGPYGIGTLPPTFYKALDKTDGKLNPEARATLPGAYKGLDWMTTQMQSVSLEVLASPRALHVDELTEYKPRLQYAGEGSAARPHQWNREWFAFLPYQVSAQKFVISYYVVTLDANQIYDKGKDPFAPARYSMPDQNFDVTIGNCAGANAKVSAYDPLTNTAVPVSVVSSTSNTLTVKLKTVDYPRVLIVEEQKAGPQILDPKISADKNGVLSLNWKTNVPVNVVKISYGKDWPNRSANEITVPAGKQEYSIKIPTGAKGVFAARIKVTVNGLTNAWPRWDEDPQGQTVVAGSIKADMTSTAPSTPPSDNAGAAAPVELKNPDGVALPIVEKSTRGCAIKLPAGASLSGPLDDREATLGSGANALRVRARYLIGSANNWAAALPFAAVGDVVEKRIIKLPSGDLATVAEYSFVPAQHPGMTHFNQKFLLLPTGLNKTDLLVLGISGTPEAMAAQDKIVTTIFAGTQSGG